MRLLLVQPTTKYPDRRPLRSRNRWLVGITLPYLASLTPKNVMVDLVDDRLDPIPYERCYDLVGITCTCATSPRAYEIAGEFRQRGVPVVMGCLHVSLHPEETMQHCDAVVVGEGRISVGGAHRGRPRPAPEASLPGPGFPQSERVAPPPPRTYGLPALPGENRPHPDLPGLSIQLCLLRGSHCLRAYLSPPPPGGSHRGN